MERRERRLTNGSFLHLQPKADGPLTAKSVGFAPTLAAPVA
jgi:hypothetical protein